jgi:hypothetical protein
MWPLDVRMLLEYYDALASSVSIAQTPETNWLTFVVRVQQSYDTQLHEMKLAADLRFESIESKRESFERALYSTEPHIDEILELYQRLSSALWEHVDPAAKRPDTLNDVLMNLADAQMLRMMPRREIKKPPSPVSTPRPKTFAPLTPAQQTIESHRPELRHYARLFRLMHERLTVDKFCEWSHRLGRDMVAFQVAPDVSALMNVLSVCGRRAESMVWDMFKSSSS